MNLTRRGLFGLLGKAAAAAGLAKVVGALPAAPLAAAPPAAAPFVGQFGFGDLVYSTSSICLRQLGVGESGQFLVYERGRPVWAHADPVVPGPVSPHEWVRDPIGWRVRRNVARSKWVRRSHPAARQFWGLP